MQSRRDTFPRRPIAKSALLTAVVLLAGFFWLNEPIRSDSGADHQDAYTSDIPLGVSGGNDRDSSRRYCCGGTLGCLVEDEFGTVYILSNNHVLARFNSASIGEDIIQPALLDSSCTETGTTTVADLSDFVTISTSGTNTVDAAIAEIRSNTMDTTGEILDIGVPSTEVLAPIVGLDVMKSGRTTGFTRGEIAAVDVTVSVGYTTRCGGNNVKVARFDNAFRIDGSSFSAGGDSGSVIFEDVTSDPRAVGLLFAGSSTQTFANPMSDVLSALDVTMVGSGSEPEPTTTGSISGTVTDELGDPISGATVQTDTGESSTTDASGDYSLADVPTGSRTVTASASGYESDSTSVTVLEDTDSTADLVLLEVVEATNAIVDCITWDTSGGRFSDKNLLISVDVVDDFGDPVANASVAVALTFPSGDIGTTTATTDDTGAAGFRVRNAVEGCYSLDVTGITSGSLTFDGAEPANGFDKGTDVAPDSDCTDASTTCTSSGAGGSGRIRPLRAQASFQAARAAKRRNVDTILGMAGVVGVGVGVDPDGNSDSCIEIYTSKEPRGRLRSMKECDGVPVRIIVTGEVMGF